MVGNGLKPIIFAPVEIKLIHTQRETNDNVPRSDWTFLRQVETIKVTKSCFIQVSGVT